MQKNEEAILKSFFFLWTSISELLSSCYFELILHVNVNDKMFNYFLGMAGKVLIVNGSDGKQQAITLNTSAAQTVVSIHGGQNPLQSKPFLLLPNGGKVPNHIQPQPTMVNPNAVRMIVAPNNPTSLQQIRPTPRATLVNQQFMAPVSLSNFQNIQPKGSPQMIRTMRPSASPVINKVVISQPKINSATPLQLGATKTIPMQTLLHGSHLQNQFSKPSLTTKPLKQLQKPATKPLASKQPNINSITVSNFIGSPKTVQTTVSIVKSSGANNTVPSNFDKTMSQHLLELEKTDPHLFTSANRLTIAPNVKTAKPTNQPSPLALQQDKIKFYLQQQKQQSQLLQQQQQQQLQQQQHQQLQQLQQQQKLQQQLQLKQQQQKQALPVSNTHVTLPNTKPLHQQTNSSAATPQSISKITGNMPQLLSSLQQQSQNQIKTMESVHQQQATLQDVLVKQKLLQQPPKSKQQTQTVHKITSAQVVANHQQQQQVISQLLTAAAAGTQLSMQQKQAIEMYVLQQKLLQVMMNLIFMELKSVSLEKNRTL